MSEFSEISISFALKDLKQEDGYDKKVYCIRFCDHIPSLWSMFATVGSNIISVYRMIPETGLAEMTHHFVDEDHDKNDTENSENFYACTWASDKHGNPVVVASGKKRILKIVNLVTYEAAALVGHGDYINELRTHTIDPTLVFSGARDQSIRLWNLKTMSCVAIFGGEKGHRDDVLCLAVHMLGNCFASSSIDTSIKIWNLRDPKLLENIKLSDELDRKPDSVRYNVIFIQAPLFSTASVHMDYIDSINWVGDSIISKSTNDRIVLWTPDALRHKVGRKKNIFLFSSI
jgi:polycomb protein EED